MSQKGRALAETVRRHVVPLFRVDDAGNPDFEGSGVLVKLDGRPLVVTAAHVLDELTTGVHLLLPGQEKNALDGRSHVTLVTPPGPRSKDLHDLGWVPLTDQEYSAADPSCFAEIGPEASAATHWLHRYLIVGYPERDQHPDHARSVYHLAQTYYTAPRLTPSKVRSVGLDPALTIAVDFNHRRIAGPKGSGGRPNFRGMSGGGIWLLDPYTSHDAHNPPALVGFLAGSPPRNRKALFGGTAALLRRLMTQVPHVAG